MIARGLTLFFRGLLVVVPIGLTLWILFITARALDGLIGIERFVGHSVPGMGLVVSIVAITFIGLLASTALTRWFFRLIDRLFQRVPLVRMLYGAIKDLIGAFVGDRKSFDQPVLVETAAGLSFLGFKTRDDLSSIGLDDHVAVYFPQSYNFAGNVLVVPRDNVRPIAVDAAQAMTFIVSGGVSGGEAAKL